MFNMPINPANALQRVSSSSRQFNWRDIGGRLREIAYQWN
jgi:hypothetical protein